MDGLLILAVIFASMGLPVMFGSMIADMTWRQAALLAAASVSVAAYFVVGSSQAFQRVYWRWTEPAPPADEAAFIAAANDLVLQRTESEGATTNQLRQAEARLCSLPVNADGWVGRVAQMYLTNTGHEASLMVEVWPRVMLRTAFFADSTNTLIRAPSPALSSVAALHVDDTVRFSGHVVGHAGACPGDPPVDRNEKLRDPEFLFYFTNVKVP